MNIGAALRGALAGWTGMTGMMFIARRMGVTQMSISEIEGTFFADPKTSTAKIAGFLLHLAMSLWIGFAYALGFRLLGWRPNAKTGAAGSLIHWLIATVVTGTASRLHPRRRQLPMPGYGGMALGIKTAIGFLVGHIIYGALFGWQYSQSDQR